MDDKRRRARVQGNWRSPPGGNPQPQPTGPALPIAKCDLNIANVVSRPKLVYKESAQSFIRSKPPDIFIDVQFYPDFIVNTEEKKSIFETLFYKTAWEDKFVIINGETFPMPRRVAWYGPIPYCFSGSTLPATPQWPPVIQYLHDQIAHATGFEFNSVLLNLYRNGKDSVAWHSDDELLMGVNPVIASLSFGETRMFEMRRKIPNGTTDDYDYVQHVKIPLKDGSLLIMQDNTQTYWQHRVPKEYHDRKPRINLTFRTVFVKPPS